MTTLLLPCPTCLLYTPKEKSFSTSPKQPFEACRSWHYHALSQRDVNLNGWASWHPTFRKRFSDKIYCVPLWRPLIGEIYCLPFYSPLMVRTHDIFVDTQNLGQHKFPYKYRMQNQHMPSRHEYFFFHLWHFRTTLNFRINERHKLEIKPHQWANCEREICIHF